MLDQNMIDLFGAGHRVDCKTLEQRRDVLLVLEESGFELTSPAQAHLSLKDNNFNYPAVGLTAGRYVDCWMSPPPSKVISYEDFVAANSGDEFFAAAGDLEMLYEKE